MATSKPYILHLFRKIKLLTPYVHERIMTQDQDFLDLFWMKQKT